MHTSESIPKLSTFSFESSPSHSLPPTHPSSRQRRKKKPYCHIPTSAASDFARTATPDPPTVSPRSQPEVSIDYNAYLQPILPGIEQAKLLNEAIEEAGDRKGTLLKRRAREERKRETTAVAAEVQVGEETKRQAGIGPYDRPDWTEKDECSSFPESTSLPPSRFPKRLLPIMKKEHIYYQTHGR